MGIQISTGFITGHKLKNIILLKPTLNNNKNLYHENVSIVQKSILSLMKAKASAAYYTFSLALCECTLH